MKNYEEMAKNVLHRMDEYEEEKSAKRAKISKAAAVVTPVCAAAVVGTYLWVGGVLTADRNQLAGSIVDDRGANSETVLSEKNNDQAETDTNTSDQQATEAVVSESNEMASHRETTEEKAAETAAPTGTGNSAEGTGNGVCLGVGEEAQPSRKLITSYPVCGEYYYIIPGNGEYHCSVPLYDAMEEYKDSANYLITVVMVNDKGLVSDRAALEAEANRLYGLGYTAAVETVSDNGSSYSYLSLNATYDQIQNFPAKADYGYGFNLYDEKD